MGQIGNPNYLMATFIVTDNRLNIIELLTSVRKCLLRFFCIIHVWLSSVYFTGKSCVFVGLLWSLFKHIVVAICSVVDNQSLTLLINVR